LYSCYCLHFASACLDPKVEPVPPPLGEVEEREEEKEKAEQDEKKPQPPEEAADPVVDLTPRIIFDTDIAEDCDDVGAMAVLHALADRGEIEVIGMMVSMPVEYGAPALDALNTFYKRPDIPIGTLKNSTDAIGAREVTVYNRDLALRFPNDLKHANRAPNSVTLYRTLLESEKDSSVVILTVGPLTNLYHLMRSEADEISPLDGMALIRKKVKRFIMAGGKLPEGTSYNFRLAPEKTEYVINRWPTEIWCVPNELGDDVLTGSEMLASMDSENPVHEAYRLYRKAHPGWQFRPSWDQMGVLIAARGEAGLFKVSGAGAVTAKRSTIHWDGDSVKNHFWFQNNSSIEERRKTIEGLMMQPPKQL
jgi:inosine-uridine nucleoside N-ribohydrolase